MIPYLVSFFNPAREQILLTVHVMADDREEALNKAREMIKDFSGWDVVDTIKTNHGFVEREK